MAAIFWDHRGVLVADFLLHGEAVTAERYCGALGRLQRATCLKMPGFLRQGVVILPGDATPLTASDT